MLFQTSDFKGRNFLKLLDDDLNPIELSAIRERLWFQQFKLVFLIYCMLELLKLSSIMLLLMSID